MTGLIGVKARGAASFSQGDCAVFRGFQGVAQRRKPTSIALEEELIRELKAIAEERGSPYQVFMRLLIADGIRRFKKAA